MDLSIYITNVTLIFKTHPNSKYLAKKNGLQFLNFQLPQDSKLTIELNSFIFHMLDVNKLIMARHNTWVNLLHLYSFAIHILSNFNLFLFQNIMYMEFDFQCILLNRQLNLYYSYSLWNKESIILSKKKNTGQSFVMQLLRSAKISNIVSIIVGNEE